MDVEDLVVRFESDRQHLRRVAFGLLGSLDDTEDALQQTWIQATGADLGDVENLTAWLTTVASRQCLDILRSKKRRREVELIAERAITAPLARRRATRKCCSPNRSVERSSC